jgi:hypothetical protein
MPTPRKARVAKRIAPAPATTQMSGPAGNATADAPGSLPVSAIDLHHEDFTAIKPFYSLIGQLYRGGYELQQHASNFLRKRPVEPPAVYTARTVEFTYQNILQSGIGAYQTGLYADPPEVFLAEEGGARITDGFLSEFLANADRCGHSLIECSKQWLTDAALNGVAFVLIDLPASSIASNFREQKARGDLNAYITTFDASQVVNWSCDQSGNYEWLVIKTQRADRVFGKPPVIIDQWYYFDRTDFRLYEAEVPDGTLNVVPGERIAHIIEQGKHALADQNRVPVRRIEVPAHLWLAYRVYLQALDHLNQDNAFSWALKQSNLAVAVITGDYEAPPVLSETAFIHLPNPDSKLTFAEQTGSSFEHAALRVAALREEIYRQMHLQAQGRSSTASASANSGYSKEMDMAPAKDISNAFGAILRDGIKGITEDVALIAGRVVDAEVTGLQAEDNNAIVDIAEGQAALDLNVPSPAFDKYVYTRVTSRVMRQAPQDQRAEVQKEIEASPSRAELAAKQQADLGTSFEQSLDSALSKGAAKQAQ